MCRFSSSPSVPLPADDTTGMNSIYTVYQGHELMFHVSTMLPYSKENKQQVGAEGFHSCDRVHMVMEKLEKSWNFKMVISRPGKVRDIFFKSL